jgi:hypothetical protein
MCIQRKLHQMVSNQWFSPLYFWEKMLTNVSSIKIYTISKYAVSKNVYFVYIVLIHTRKMPQLQNYDYKEFYDLARLSRKLLHMRCFRAKLEAFVDRSCVCNSRSPRGHLVEICKQYNSKQ